MVCARSINSKGGKMAIANAQPNVLKVLSTSGIGEVVSVNPSLETAIAAVGTHTACAGWRRMTRSGTR